MALPHEVIPYDPETHLTVAEVAARRGVSNKTVIGWINRKLMPAVRATVAPSTEKIRKYTTRWQWVVERDAVDTACTHAFVVPQFTELIDGVEVEWITLKEAAKRRGCNEWSIRRAVRIGTIQAQERQLYVKSNGQTRTYVRADQLAKVAIREPPTIHDRQAGALQIRTKMKGARIVRTADGWRIQYPAGDLTLRSVTEWATRAEALTALTKGGWR